MRLLKIETWTSDDKQLRSWRDNGIFGDKTEPLFLAMLGCRGWIVNPIDMVNGGFTMVEVASWDKYWDFIQVKNEEFKNYGVRDVLAADDVFGPGRWYLVCQFCCMLVTRSDGVYMTQTGQSVQ